MTTTLPSAKTSPLNRLGHESVLGLVLDMLAVALVVALDTFFTYPLDEATADSMVVPPWLLLALIALALLWRRRYPLEILVTVTALSCLIQLLAPTSAVILSVFLALNAAASFLPRAAARWSLVVAALPLALMIVHLQHFGDIDWTTYIFSLAFFGGLGLVAWLLGRRERRGVAETARLTQELEVKGRVAARLERQRIARELHDILAHSVSAMMMQAAGARAMAGSVAKDLPDDRRLQAVTDALATIETTGSQSMRELHRLLGALRNDADDHHAASSSFDPDDADTTLPPSSKPGLGDLEDLVLLPRRSGLIVEVHRSGEPGRLDPSVGAAAYRVVQESLTNALKHAGRGAVVDIYESWQGDEVQVQVRCRGSHGAVKPGTPSGGIGLAGLRERVDLVGGTFAAGWAGDEFVTTAVLPFRPEPSRSPGLEQVRA